MSGCAWTCNLQDGELWSPAREGADVTVNGRTKERVDAAVERIGGTHGTRGQVTGIDGDVSTAAGARGIAERLPDVDILVNNAGIFELKAFEQIPDEDCCGCSRQM